MNIRAKTLNDMAMALKEAELALGSLRLSGREDAETAGKAIGSITAALISLDVDLNYGKVEVLREAA